MNNVTAKQVADTLVIFLVLDTFEFKVEEARILEKLASAKIKNSNKVFLIKDTVQRIKQPQLEYVYPFEVLEIATDATTGKTDYMPVSTENVNTQRGDAWLQAFGELYSMYDAKFTSFIIWSHGGGTVVENNLSNPLKNPAAVPANGSQSPCQFCEQLEVLYVSQIALGLKKVLGDKKIDMMIMCNCNMQLIDNLYNLSDVTSYYFASMSPARIDSYDFGGIIKYMNDTKITDVESYVKDIVQIIFNAYQAMIENAVEVPCLVATRLAEASKIKDALNEICDFLLEHKPYETIENMLAGDVLAIASLVFFDSITFFEVLDQKLSYSEFHSSVEKFKTLLVDEMRFAKLIKESLENIPQLSPKCATIFFPGPKKDRIPDHIECEYIKHCARNSFIEDIRWANIINEFVAWRKTVPAAMAHP